MNKYSILAAAVIMIILCLSFFNLDPEEDKIIGYADDISSSENGYIFYIIDENGNRIKAFYSENIDDSLFIFSGSFSDDGSIFFVKKAENY